MIQVLHAHFLDIPFEDIGCPDVLSDEARKAWDYLRGLSVALNNNALHFRPEYKCQYGKYRVIAISGKQVNNWLFVCPHIVDVGER